MKKIKVFLLIIFSCLICFLSLDIKESLAAIIIDHTTTDLSQIPTQWINAAKANLKMYYVHASHGGQLTMGLQRIEDINSWYSVAIADGSLPNESGAFNVYDLGGSPMNFWQYYCWSPGDCADGPALTRQVLNANPSINVTGFGWCVELNGESQQYAQDYLNSMSQLEAEFPNVKFIYMTGTADLWWDNNNNSGVNRHLRNEQIRQYARNNNKILFDFEDLDSWWQNPSSGQWEHFTVTSGGYTFSVPAAAFSDGDCGHMTNAACEQKARAVWWMLARLAGWSGSSAPDTTPPTVFVTAPANGATVSGTSVTVSANATDNVGVVGVQFKLDGANLGTEDTTSPYSISWNTTTTSNGSHTLTAVARDAAGNQTTSSAVIVTVNNDTTPPAPPLGVTVN